MSTSRLAQTTLKLCINQHLAIHKWNQKLLWMGWNWRGWSSSFTETGTLFRVYCCLAKTSGVFRRLQVSLWEQRGSSLSTKLNVCCLAVLPVVLCACQTWALYQRHAHKQNHMTFLNLGPKILWQDQVEEAKVLEQASLSTYDMVPRHNQLQWVGHMMSTYWSICIVE